MLGAVRDTALNRPQPQRDRLDLAGLERAALAAALEDRGHESFRATQIFRWIYRRGVTNAEAMSDLPRELRATLADSFALSTPGVAMRQKSGDGTEKFLLRLADGRHVES